MIHQLAMSPAALALTTCAATAYVAAFALPLGLIMVAMFACWRSK